jgi:hypothetical protein
MTVIANLTPAQVDLLAAVRKAYAEHARLAGRRGDDWAHDGYSLPAAQRAVDAAKARYDEAFSAYAATI